MAVSVRTVVVLLWITATEVNLSSEKYPSEET